MMQVSTGRMLWGVLHEYSENPGNAQHKQAFLEQWFTQVKESLGCASCFKKLERFQRLWPTPDGEELYLWGLCLHDYVNKELGKPLHFPESTLAPLKQKGIVQ